MNQSSSAEVGWVELDPEWSGTGKPQKVTYISRWCPDFQSFQENKAALSKHEVLNVLLIERVEGWAEVKRRVQMLEQVDLLQWRKAKPRWELVSLA